MKQFDQMIEQLKESLKISRGTEYSRAIFPEGEIIFKEKAMKGVPYLEMHIQIKSKYQRKGHAAEKIKELIRQTNISAYFSHGRILNDQVYKVLDKIRSDNNFEVVEDERGVWVNLIK